MDPLEAALIGIAGALLGILGTAVKGLVEARIRPPNSPHEDITSLTVSIGALTQRLDRQTDVFERQGLRMDRQVEALALLSQGIAISNERLAQLLARRD